MKSTFLFISLIVTSLAFSQSVLPVRKNGFWGLVSDNGKPVLKAKYDYIFNFENRPFTVFLDKTQYGILDKKGTVIIEPKYKTIEILQDSFFIVTDDSGKGLLNSKKAQLFDNIFEKIDKLSDEVFQASNDTCRFIYHIRSGKKIDVSGLQVAYVNEMYSINNNDSIHLLNGNLEPIFSCKNLGWYSSSSDFVVYSELGQSNIPKACQNRFPFGFTPILNFNREKQYYVVEKEEYYGVYSLSEEKFIIPPDIEQVEINESEYVLLVRDSKAGLVDRNANQILPFEYEDIFIFYDGFLVQNPDLKYGLVTKGGRWIIPMKYDWLEDKGNHYQVFKNGKAGIYSKGGAQVESCTYDDIKVIGNDFKCYSGPIKNKNGKIYKYRKVVSFSLEGGVAQGRIEFENVGVVNIDGIRAREYGSDFLNARAAMNDSIFRWKRIEKKFRLKNGRSDIQNVWGMRDTTYKRYVVPSEYTDIELFMDRNYTLARRYGFGYSKVLRSPITDYSYSSEFRIIDHDKVGRYKLPSGFISLSDIYQNKDRIQLFDGNSFVFFALDSSKAIDFAYLDHTEYDGLRRAAVNGAYRHCSTYDPMKESLIMDFINRINDIFSDSVPNGKGQRISYAGEFKNTPFKIENAQWALVGPDYQPVTDKYYSFISKPIRQKYLTNYKGKWGLMTIDSVLIPFELDGIRRLRNDEDSILIGNVSQFQEFIIDSLGNKVNLDLEITIQSHEGNAVVFSKKGKYGLMDGDFQTIHDAEYGRIKYLDFGWFRYRSKGKMGVISSKGDVVPPKFKELQPLDEDYILFKSKKFFGVLNSRGDTIVSPEYLSINRSSNHFILSTKTEAFLSDLKGNILKKVKGEFKGDFGSGFLFQLKKAIAILDENGKPTHKINNAIYSEHSDQLLIASLKGQQKILNADLEIVVDTIGDYNLLKGLYYTEADKKEKIIRKIGEEKPVDIGKILKVQVYDDLIVYKNHGKYKVLNSTTGSMKDFEEEVGKVMSFHDDYFIILYKNRTQAFLDREGENIYKRSFEQCSEFVSGYSVVKDKNELKIFYRNGKLIEGLVYHKILPMYNGYFKAQILQKYGLLNENGEELVELEYDKIVFSDNQMVQLHKDGEVFYYDFEKRKMVK